MDVSRRRVGVRSSVVAGSVWETRMKSDQVRGGVKVFNADENGSEEGGTARFKRTQIGVAIPTGKRKTWKSDSPDGSEKTPIHIARGKTEQQQSNTVSSDEITPKKSPILVRKKIIRTQGAKEVPVGGRSSPIQASRKLRSEEEEEKEEQNGNRDSVKAEDQSVKGVSDGNGESSIQPRETESESNRDLAEESINGIDESGSGPDGVCGNVLMDESCKDFGVCQDKVISSTSDNADEEEDEDVDEAVDIEMEKNSFVVKEISVPESMVANEPEKKVIVNEPEKKEIVKEPLKKVVVKEQEKHKIVNESEPKKIATTRFHQKNERPVSSPITVKQSPPVRRQSTIYQNFPKTNSIPKAEAYRSFPQTQSKLQSLVDLIMWRDISRSAFMFGTGTFLIVSSSYAKDINLSLISVSSYFGLVYLAVIFLYRSLICRGIIDVDNTNYVLGEEEAIWLLKLILPYLNEFLLRLRAMFSGDPGTTMKLAVLLFVLARCGSSITIWKMAKFGFFGVFTLPKICSLYSTQITAYANFWIRRFRDAWDSCSHKKAVALGIFGLVWNLSSVVARIWAVFVLFVAFRYYQQHYLVRDEWEEDEAGCDETWHEQHVGVQRQRRAPNLVVDTHNKVKKGY
ncbi:reticulon-like protein B21 [Arachis stenosperma]|uniref:reticulon-like protein B21 n=1 Tax=Arachis stenosperma TaxID=217475 RepID=UPI0025ACA9D7|nr:reticulon-like protein B21 [Arachis stenosperma]